MLARWLCYYSPVPEHEAMLVRRWDWKPIGAVQMEAFRSPALAPSPAEHDPWHAN
jgi:hypothetical protein